MKRILLLALLTLWTLPALAGGGITFGGGGTAGPVGATGATGPQGPIGAGGTWTNTDGTIFIGTNYISGTVTQEDNHVNVPANGISYVATNGNSGGVGGGRAYNKYNILLPYGSIAQAISNASTGDIIQLLPNVSGANSGGAFGPFNPYWTEVASKTLSAGKLPALMALRGAGQNATMIVFTNAGVGLTPVGSNEVCCFSAIASNRVQASPVQTSTGCNFWFHDLTIKGVTDGYIANSTPSTGTSDLWQRVTISSEWDVWLYDSTTAGYFRMENCFLSSVNTGAFVGNVAHILSVNNSATGEVFNTTATALSSSAQTNILVQADGSGTVVRLHGCYLPVLDSVNTTLQINGTNGGWVYIDDSTTPLDSNKCSGFIYTQAGKQWTNQFPTFATNTVNTGSTGSRILVMATTPTATWTGTTNYTVLSTNFTTTGTQNLKIDFSTMVQDMTGNSQIFVSPVLDGSQGSEFLIASTTAGVTINCTPISPWWGPLSTTGGVHTISIQSRVNNGTGLMGLAATTVTNSVTTNTINLAVSQQ